MNFNEFTEMLVKDAQERLQEVYPRIELAVQDVEKINESYKGIVLKNDNNVCPVLNAESYYDDLRRGVPYQKILNGFTVSAMEALNDARNIYSMLQFDEKTLADNIRIQLIPTEKNKELLKTIPHREIEDLSLVYRMNVGFSDHRESSVVINNNMLSMFGIDEDQLNIIAMENAPMNMPIKICSMAETLEEMGQDGLQPEDAQIPMYVVTNQAAVYGASALFYPDVMDRCADIMNGNFFIIPSSLHEVIIVPTDSNTSYVLKEMVEEVNNTQVEEKDILSYQVYHYDYREKVFELAEKYETRVAAQKRQSVLGNLEGKKKELFSGNIDRRNQDIGCRKVAEVSL